MNMMNVEALIKRQAMQFKNSRREIDIAPELDLEMAKKWEKKYARCLDSGIADYLLVMSYTKTGNFAFTGNALYYDNYLQDGLKVINFSDISSVAAQQGGVFSIDRVCVRLKSGNTVVLDGCIDGIHVERFAQLLTNIANCVSSDTAFIVSKQQVLSYQLPDNLKLLYLKILCNYSYLNDMLIDAAEYNAIARFSVRMELGSEVRTAFRTYMNHPEAREKTGVVMQKIKALTKNATGQWDALRFSLMQDVLSIHNIQASGQAWTEDGFIGSLMEACGLCPDQVETMVTAVDLNTRMQQKGADLSALKKAWAQLLKRTRYSTGYVPAPYLFCSGSVYGIDTYTNFLKKEDMSEKAINKHRELILHEIILNNQKTMNVIVDDMNYLADMLKTVATESSVNKEKYQKLLERLKRASQGLRMDAEQREAEYRDAKEASDTERNGYEKKEDSASI